MNVELLVSIYHDYVLTTSLPFVHTARRLNWLDVLVITSDKSLCVSTQRSLYVVWTISSEEWESRNKVSVGEPAEGLFVDSYISNLVWLGLS